MKVEVTPFPIQLLGLEVGEIGLAPDGMVVLRAASGFINLANPEETWTNPSWAKELHPLAKGTQVILTV